MPGIISRVTSTYYTGFSSTRDIARDADGNIWVATDNSPTVLGCFNTSNQMIDQIDNSLVPYARGVTMDTGGYLWVSDIQNDLIYKIDLQLGISGEGAGSIEAALRSSCNPFQSSVTITGSGFGPEAAIEIFDASGRLVVSDVFSGTYTWNSSSAGRASSPSGLYIVRVIDSEGIAAELSLVKL